MRTWDDGGWSAEYKNVDEFVETRKGNVQVQAEWTSSRNLTIKDVEEGPERCSRAEKGKIKDRHRENRK
eukprot:1958453-Pyramimonas_sp.AAC.1